MPATTGSRAKFREDVLADLLTRAKDRAVLMEDGPLGGLRLVSTGVLDELCATLASEPLPPTSATHAEVRTPGSVTVSVICPTCDLPGAIVLSLEPELRIGLDGAELHVKAKSKPRTHVCHQLELPQQPVAAGQAEMFADDSPAPEARILMLEPGAIALGDGEPAEEGQFSVALEYCDFPGCTLYAFHSGAHEDESGQELVA